MLLDEADDDADAIASVYADDYDTYEEALAAMQACYGERYGVQVHLRPFTLLRDNRY